MSSLLFKLYSGNFCPSNAYSDRIAGHREKRQACWMRYDSLMQRAGSLDSKLKQDLEQFLDQQLDTDLLDLPEAFIDGFRMGAQFMIEILR